MINFLIILFGLTMIYASSTSRVEAYVRVLSIQGLLLFFMAVIDYNGVFDLNFGFLLVETLIFKTILIPVFLMRISRRTGILRELNPQVPNFWAVLIASVIFVFGFFMAYVSVKLANDIKPLYFGISVSTTITGLFVIIVRKKIITHIIGYMLIENGIFLLSLAVVNEMPFIVNLGVLLDVFIGVYLFGLFFNKIQATYEETHIDSLTNLKD